MITQAMTFGSEGETTTIVNARAALAHPLADEVSIALGSGQYSRFPYSVELAFFKNGEWVTEPLPELAEYYSGEVYPFVPLIEFVMFLENFRVVGS
jgi:hypothetical protein